MSLVSAPDARGETQWALFTVVSYVELQGFKSHHT